MRRRNSSSPAWTVAVWGAALAALAAAGQAPAQSAQPSPKSQGSSGATSAPQPANVHTPAPQKKRGGYTLSTDVNLVVLHATVLDKKGRMVSNLEQQDFRVAEDGTPQKLSVFSHADIPVTLGIVIDDSASMREKRPAVNAAALTFVKTSNPQDQVFVVNFNDNYYLDTPGDFAAGADDLKAALEKIDSRGGTALYDAVDASLDHLKLGDRDKKVLLVVTDGDDDASRYTLDDLVRHAQHSNAVIYVIGLVGEETEAKAPAAPPGTQDTGLVAGPTESGSGPAATSDSTRSPHELFKIHRSDKKFAKILRSIAASTGGQAYFPKSLDEVQSTCRQIAHDIRDQYTLGYYPTNKLKDGTFRAVQVQALRPGTRKRLVVRTRPGYYAPKPNTTEARNVASGQ